MIRVTAAIVTDCRNIVIYRVSQTALPSKCKTTSPIKQKYLVIAVLCICGALRDQKYLWRLRQTINLLRCLLRRKCKHVVVPFLQNDGTLVAMIEHLSFSKIASAARRIPRIPPPPYPPCVHTLSIPFARLRKFCADSSGQKRQCGQFLSAVNVGATDMPDAICAPACVVGPTLAPPLVVLCLRAPLVGEGAGG